MKHLHPPFVLFIALLLLMVIPLSPPASAAKSDKIKSDKVDVCHLPESTSDNRHIINISANGNALNAHLSHGDWEATAEKCDAIPDNDCDSEPDPVADDADCVAINGGPGWTCQIGVCNSPPTDIALDSADIDENLASGTPVGTLSSTDPDSPGPFTYTLVSGDGDSDNAAFSVSGSQLLSAASFNFESKNSYNARLMTDAGDGGTYQEAITISVNDINEAPTVIVLENDSIHENQAAGTLISYFTTSDVDAGDSHAYTLVAGPVATDNASFDIVDDRLVSAESFDFETRDSYSVRVQSQDSGGLTVAQSYLITIIDVNDPPTAIAFDNSDIEEEQAVGTPVGTFSSTDVDSSIFSYSLVAGFGDADNASFSIVGDELQSAVVFDYDVQDSFDIRVQTDDGDGGTFQETFTVIVVSVCGDDCFPNGVAAGDVDQTSVVLWTRASYEGKIVFEYGTDPDFLEAPIDSIVRDVCDIGTGVCDTKIPLKAEISGLFPGTQYHYRVCRGSCAASFAPETEAKGDFRTPFADADGQKGLRFGVSSCWREKERPFDAIKNIPQSNLDFFVALGDTVYADDPLVPKNNPNRETINRDLDGFRDEHILGYEKTAGYNYFADARASTAIYATIDDHEIANNFQGGASPLSQRVAAVCVGGGICFCDPSNDPTFNCVRPYINETDLYMDGLQAWHEFNPIQEKEYGDTNDPRTAFKKKLYRYRTFGKDAAMLLLDTRSFRDHPIALSVVDILPATAWGAGRTMLGDVQLDELLENLVDAQNRGITWKFVLVPEPIQNMSKFGAGDRFEGYAYERAVILEHIRENCITNVVFISGDIHGTLTNNLVYKKNFLDKKIYSSTWDISAGPAGHGAPIGAAFLGGLGYWAQPSRDDKNNYFEDWVNTALLVNLSPYVGLDKAGTDALGPYNFIRDQQNALPPANLVDLDENMPGKQGRYSSTNTNGWTEFEIDEATQNLLVTTWGIERGPDGDETSLVRNTDGVPDIDGELSPFIVSQFTVEARSKSDISCGIGKPNGSICAFDSACASGSCYLLACRAKGNVGDQCLQDTDCLSEYCTDSFFPGNRVCEVKREVGEQCKYDTDCVSEYCTDSVLPGNRVCEVKKQVGDSCRYDTDCVSEYCTDSVLPGNRVCEVKKQVGDSCRYDTDCVSEYCTDSVLPGNRVCEVKKQVGDSCRYDTDCVSEYCTDSVFPGNRVCEVKKQVGDSCRYDTDCRSGDCSNEAIPSWRTCR